MALIDINYVKQGSLGFDLNDPTLDTAISLWIDEAGARILNECNQSIEEVTETDYVFSGNGKTTHTFGVFPVTALTKLEAKTGTGTAAVWTEITTTEYELVTTDGYFIHYPARFTCGISNYRMTFTHGYPPSGIPDDIKSVAREMVTKLYTDYLGSGGKGQFGKSMISQNAPGGGSLNTTLKDLAPSWTRILSGYTVLNVRRR